MRIIRFLKALYKYILYGKRVSFNTYVERLDICNKCSYFKKDNWTCNMCGCYVDKKGKMSSENCPENFWKDINERS